MFQIAGGNGIYLPEFLKRSLTNHVVPAKAGTHNPWRWLLQKAFAPVLKR
jgi:hypothetical protein